MFHTFRTCGDGMRTGQVKNELYIAGISDDW